MTPEARAARERKQKIFVVIGGLLLVGMLAIQLPKLLGGSSSSQAAPATTDESTLPRADGLQDGSAPPPRSVQTAEFAKLTLFSSFTAKDPFVQQVVTRPPTAGGGSGEAGKTKADAAAEKPEEFATGPAVTTAATIVTVNGVRHVLEPGARFPASDPLFVLVAEKPGSKAVVLAIAGGAYASGAKTMPLRMGKPLTLVNTTTGAKYKIALVSVGSGDAPDSGVPQP